MAISRMRFKANNNGTYYIDLAKALSVQERKLHRQKAIYTVYGGYFVDGQGNRVDINTAPMTWVSKRAVNRGFALWRKMIAKTFDNMSANQSSSKYRDFKVFLDNQMGGAPLSPLDASDNLIGNGEWDYSTLTTADPDAAGVPTGDDFELQICGPHVGSPNAWSRIGLIQSWVNSRDPPDTIEPRDVFDNTDPLMNLFDTGDIDDNRMAIINSENDATPYDEETMFGIASPNGSSNNLQRVSSAQPTANTQLVAPIHGFQALCGLVQVVVGEGSAANQWELVLDVETKGEKF